MAPFTKVMILAVFVGVAAIILRAEGILVTHAEKAAADTASPAAVNPVTASDRKHNARWEKRDDGRAVIDVNDLAVDGRPYFGAQVRCLYHPRNPPDGIYTITIFDPSIRPLSVNEDRGTTRLELSVDGVDLRVKAGSVYTNDEPKRVSAHMGEDAASALRRGSKLIWRHHGKGGVVAGGIPLTGSARAIHSLAQCKSVYRERMAKVKSRQRDIEKANARYLAKANDHCSKESVSRFEKRGGGWRFVNGVGHSAPVTDSMAILRLELLLRNSNFLTRQQGIIYASFVPEICPNGTE